MKKIQKVQVVDRLESNKVISEHKTWSLAERAAKKLGCGDRFFLRLKYDDQGDCPR